MSLEDFSLYMEKLRPCVHTVQLFWQGEPLLNRDLPEMVRLAREAGMFTVVSTNAQALDSAMAERLVAAGLHRLIVSIDGLTEKSYSAYRVGGSLDRALSGLMAVREAKNRANAAGCRRGLRRIFPIIELQMLRLRSNEDEWPFVRHVYRELGADRLVMKTAQFYDYEHGNPLMPTDERYSRYTLGPDGRYRPKRSPSRHCRRLWTSLVVGVDGTVYPCCYDKSHRFPLGSLRDASLAEIWHSEAADRFRRMVVSDAPKADICTNCIP